MIVPILTALLPLIPKVLEFIAHERDARHRDELPVKKSEDNVILETVREMVTAISKAHPDWLDEEKARVAASASRAHLEKFGIRLTDSQLNVLVELYAAKAAADRREDTNG